MLLTDGWWRGSTENTSITSAWCHKTVKQKSESHWAGTFRHTHESTTSPVKPAYYILASATEHSRVKFSPYYILNSHADRSRLNIYSCNRCIFWCRQAFFSPVYKQPTATILQVFIRARDRRPWCSKNPQLLPVQFQPPAVKDRKQLKHAPS